MRTGPKILAVGLVGLFAALLWQPAGEAGMLGSCPYLSGGGGGGAKGQHRPTPEQFSSYDAAQHLPQPPQLVPESAPGDDADVADADLPLMTERELARHDGRGDASLPLLLSVGRMVYNVGERGGLAFYGTGGAYHLFAGRACSRGVALPSLEPADISDDIGDFDAAQVKRLVHWTKFFRAKYRRVARLAPATDEERARLRRERERREAAARALHEQREKAATRANMLQGGGRVFSRAELALHDGTDAARELPLLLAVGGHVLDVSSSKYFYGPGSPRHVYAGRAVTRALTLQSTKLEDLGDRVDDLTVAQKATMQSRINYFLSKFPKVGVLAPGGGGGERPYEHT
jgi:membrane-associated progesterone receptor component